MMNSTIKKVFMIVALLVGIFLAWQLVFNDGGIIKTIYNAIITGINGQWKKVAGDTSKLLPEWGDTSAVEDASGKGFEINTKK